MVRTLRSQALGLPSKAAPRLVNLKSAGEAQKVLAEEVRGWLQDLAHCYQEQARSGVGGLRRIQGPHNANY